MEEKGLILPEINDDGQYVVQIKEEYIKTGGHFQAQSFSLDVLIDNGTYNLDIIFKHAIGILDAYAYIDEEMNNDEVECIIGENSIVGFITSAVNIDDDIINVSDTVLEYCDIGYYINLYDGENYVDLGKIIEKNLDNKTITLENKSTKNFNAESYVRMSIKLVPYMILKGNSKLTFAYKKTGTNYLPKNTNFRIKYTNKNNTAKKFIFILEYLY